MIHNTVSTSRSRGLSTTIGYAAMLSITVILLGILLSVFSLQMNTQIDEAKTTEIEISSSQLAAEFEQVDAIIRTSNPNEYELYPEMSRTAGNEGYRIYIDETGTENIYDLTLETESQNTVTQKMRIESDVDTDEFANSRSAIIKYDPVEDQLKITNRERIELPDLEMQSYSNDYTIGSNVDEEPPIDADGTVTGGQNSTVVGSILASDTISLDEDIYVNGNIESTNMVQLSDRSSINGNIDSVQSVTLEDEIFVAGIIQSDGQISTGDNVLVGNTLRADSNINLGTVNTVSGIDTTEELSTGDIFVSNGDINARSVTLGEDSVVYGSVSASNTVELQFNTTIEGDVNVTSGSDITCENQVTINGQPCPEYIDDNY